MFQDLNTNQLAALDVFAQVLQKNLNSHGIVCGNFDKITAFNDNSDRFFDRYSTVEFKVESYDLSYGSSCSSLGGDSESVGNINSYGICPYDVGQSFFSEVRNWLAIISLVYYSIRLIIRVKRVYNELEDEIGWYPYGWPGHFYCWGDEYDPYYVIDGKLFLFIYSLDRYDTMKLAEYADNFVYEAESVENQIF